MFEHPRLESSRIFLLQFTEGETNRRKRDLAWREAWTLVREYHT